MIKKGYFIWFLKTFNRNTIVFFFSKEKWKVLFFGKENKLEIFIQIEHPIYICCLV